MLESDEPDLPFGSGAVRCDHYGVVRLRNDRGPWHGLRRPGVAGAERGGRRVGSARRAEKGPDVLFASRRGFCGRPPTRLPRLVTGCFGRPRSKLVAHPTLAYFSMPRSRSTWGKERAAMRRRSGRHTDLWKWDRTDGLTGGSGDRIYRSAPSVRFGPVHFQRSMMPSSPSPKATSLLRLARQACAAFG